MFDLRAERSFRAISPMRTLIVVLVLLKLDLASPTLSCDTVLWFPRPMENRNLTLIYARQDASIAEALECILTPFFNVSEVGDVGFHVDVVDSADLCDTLRNRTARYGALNMAITVSSNHSRPCEEPGKRRVNIIQIYRNPRGDWKAQIGGIFSSMLLSLGSNTPEFDDLVGLMQITVAIWRPRVTFDQHPRRYKTLEGRDQKIVTDVNVLSPLQIVIISVSSVLFLALVLVVVIIAVKHHRRCQALERLRRQQAFLNSSNSIKSQVANSMEDDVENSGDDSCE